jgi:hypothetical protein
LAIVSECPRLDKRLSWSDRVFIPEAFLDEAALVTHLLLVFYFVGRFERVILVIGSLLSLFAVRAAVLALNSGLRIAWFSNL